jgi:hypothetical protein
LLLFKRKSTPLQIWDSLPGRTATDLAMSAMSELLLDGTLQVSPLLFICRRDMLQQVEVSSYSAVLFGASTKTYTAGVEAALMTKLSGFLPVDQMRSPAALKEQSTFWYYCLDCWLTWF